MVQGTARLTISLQTIVLAALFSILALYAIAPPIPHAIAGWIFQGDGVTQVPLGTDYSINNTNISGEFFQNVTRIPIPGQSGRYSELLNGSDGELIRVVAWNLTHFGYTEVNLSGDMDNVNVTMALARNGTPEVTLIFPSDNTPFDRYDPLTIVANLTILDGPNATNCNVSVSFTSSAVISLVSGQNTSYLFNSLANGTNFLLNWSANATNAGITDVVVTAVCSDAGVAWAGSDNDTSENITVTIPPPPLPHGVAGWIFDCDNTTQVPLGTLFAINDTDSGYYLQNETRIPFPGNSGRYSEIVQGVDGDNVTVLAWNTTHWGSINVTLVGDMDEINLSLCIARGSAPNVTITWPPNATPITSGAVSNVTARIQIIGGSDGENCSATVSFSNESVINITSSETYTTFVGNITLESFTYVSWNVSANEGQTNVTVNASCDSDNKQFDEIVNLRSQTVLANISADFPLYVVTVQMQDTIDLQAGTTTTVHCNATIFDANLAANITHVNATLYDVNASFSSDADDNNIHYTNASCTNTSIGLFEANFTCTFDVWYYANNGTWACNVTAFDNITLNANHSSNTTTVNSLLAIFANQTLDFGNLAPLTTSPVDVNLTMLNFGNTDFNISLEGHGATQDDGLAMDCPIGNISIGQERYSMIFGESYGVMTPLTSDPVSVDNSTLYQRTDDVSFGNDRNASYWKLSVPTGVGGQCNGTITLLATI